MTITFTLDAQISTSGTYPHNRVNYGKTSSFTFSPDKNDVIPIPKTTKKLNFKAQNSKNQLIRIDALIKTATDGSILLPSKDNGPGRKSLEYENLDFSNDEGETETFYILVTDGTDYYCLDPKIQINT